MKLSELGEFGLIEQIRRTFAKRSPQAPIGIGDDAAALFVSPGSAVLATTDMLIEGVHFDRSTTDLFSLGWKSAAANLSDIAAMGGSPRFALVALALPSPTTAEQVAELYRGFTRIAKRHGTLIVGGDTCGSLRDLVISVTVLGEAKRKEIVTRAGAAPGDLVFVTGTLGDSAAGLELVRSAEYGVRSKDPNVNKLIEKHLRPVPRVAWGRKIAASRCASAMIDVSDGLSSDLGHICDESGVGAEVSAEQLPLSRALLAMRTLLRPPLWYALSGGEDYELLFTVPPGRLQKLRALRIPARLIGAITKDLRRVLIGPGGRKQTLAPSGYDHFAGPRAGKGPKR
jgi:thiamine-monophosphate kinase